MIRVIWNMPSVIAGRISALMPAQEVKPVVHQPPICVTGPRPKLGSQPSHTANTRISRMPSRKVGSDTPTRLTTMNRRDRKALR